MSLLEQSGLAEPWLLAVVVLAGLAAGFINTMAGGGSLLTLPALMLLGLPADVANGTNRPSVVAQSISGVWAYHRKGKLDTSAILPTLAPTVLGSFVGAAVAASAPAYILKPVMLTIMVGVALLMALSKPRTFSETSERTALGAKGWLGLFGAGLYGGFIQAGVGFVLIAVLTSALSFDLLRANALKLVCTLIFGLVALGIFTFNGQVRWIPGAILALAGVVGSQLGVRFALNVKPKVIRWVIVICVSTSCVAILLK